jgi:hypothetical protein
MKSDFKKAYDSPPIKRLEPQSKKLGIEKTITSSIRPRKNRKTKISHI